jgi:hypothetical protein
MTLVSLLSQLPNRRVSESAIFTAHLLNPILCEFEQLQTVSTFLRSMARPGWMGWSGIADLELHRTSYKGQSQLPCPIRQEQTDPSATHRTAQLAFPVHESANLGLECAERPRKPHSRDRRLSRQPQRRILPSCLWPSSSSLASPLLGGCHWNCISVIP